MYEKPRFKKREIRYKVYFSELGKRWFTYIHWKDMATALIDVNHLRKVCKRRAVIVKETITREIVPDDSEPQGKS